MCKVYYYIIYTTFFITTEGKLLDGGTEFNSVPGKFITKSSVEQKFGWLTKKNLER